MEGLIFGILRYFKRAEKHLIHYLVGRSWYLILGIKKIEI